MTILRRLTAQRSMEDAEEAERERRRRAREASWHRNSDSVPKEESDTYDFKPSSSPSLEEDEGFSDWTQRRERRLQQRLQEVVHRGTEDKEDEEEHNAVNRTSPENTSITSSGRLMRDADDGDEDGQAEGRQQVQVSYTSKVFLVQDPKHSNTDADHQEVTSSPNNQSEKPARSSEQGEADAIVEAERRLEKIRCGLQEKENQEAEQLRCWQAEAELELEELKGRRELRCHVHQEEEQRREKEEKQRLAKEEEERRRMREDMERRRMDAAVTMKSMSEHDAVEACSPFSPKTPTHKITERTESLNRSLKKSNSFKKTQALVLVSKIDDKMEKYAHAVENSQEPRGAKAPMVDMPNSLEAVTFKKNLFEAGEAWSSSPAKTTASKDTEGLKVGVANMITQWVKGQADSSRPSQSRPADVKCGDVMQKKNMWEIIGDSSGKQGQNMMGSAANKKYKFVVTGHGKYEKITVGHGGDGTNAESDLYQSDY
ncbi:non-muscle caldesmon isoform X2 [Dunckerocampus dactyliophorus]|uniref:non-muscle caldesmon isoform X2 n=1 Tax=Dunckerocampus dactyliophorus TaxID=161453 RepID=UPI0024072446|nr:non-muscle caldesmon isoform X2 [Dunckerocampus dactyliophorus]XP_054632255.1 non-muscle caldesmon isoform X2 [Dunckerocampus dactyliophorus]XP_054632256.1 non-muscle caldesmon isoform X2 [Dunckerocampus dactyliophorus]